MTRVGVHRSVPVVVLATVLLTAVVPFQQTSTAHAAVTTRTFAAEADTRVEKSQPTRNFGTATTLTADGSPVVESYLRFVVSGVSGTVTRAVLRLYVTNGSVDAPAVYPSATTWTETGTTWNNRPARTGGVIADKGAVNVGTWAEYDVTSHVSAAGTYSFNLATPSGDSLNVNSRQSSSTTQRPQLVVTADDGGTAAPAPTDTTAPETAIGTAPAGTIDVRSVSLAFTSSEAGSTFQCSLDGAAATSCTSPQAYGGLADGPHTFQVRARDAAGNVDATPAVATWTVDAVTATVETTPVPHSGDAADDPAVWVDAADPAHSAVVGTDKLGGLVVYDLAGRELQYLPVGRVNNVDVLPDFSLGGRSVPLVVAGNRTTNSIGFYELAPATRQLGDVAARVVTPGLVVYGSCTYRSPTSGRSYVFVNSKEGQVEQWELVDSAGRVDARLVRAFDVGTTTEGCVADRELAQLYVSEELVGIWKYGAEPGDGITRTLVAPTSPGGPLVSDVEGLTIAYGPNGTGHLLASSQGNSSYVVYRREGDNAFVRSFRITAANGVDGTESTDGIDVVTTPLGPAFPRGLLAVQDGTNDGGNQDFKFVPWEDVLPG